jgi:hypothetical protein
LNGTESHQKELAIKNATEQTAKHREAGARRVVGGVDGGVAGRPGEWRSIACMSLAEREQSILKKY